MTAAPIRFRAPLIASAFQGTSLINRPPVLKHTEARKTNNTDLFLFIDRQSQIHTYPVSPFPRTHQILFWSTRTKQASVPSGIFAATSSGVMFPP